ncbi:hypothetical protein GUJ93_ZPchr0002g24714 [Zizania palustris]|uniref:Uncharacterized protein n=1 Tax=Zizania palustris TaxID=103762 RepID=A0A8J5VWL9_ZIZPA|nr:hypothetical protein GUJ93_ZPchr0002g24714 [Zizania palustris]
MASHKKLSTLQCLLFLLCYVAAEDTAHPLSHGTSHHSVSYTPQLHDFPNERLYRAYVVIQRFKGTITSDPKNITDTWTGHDICGRTTYLGFYCTKLSGADEVLTVTDVLFNGFGLRAPKLTGFIDQLPDIALFHAASNNFGSDIPRLAGLGYIYEFNIINDIKPQMDGKVYPASSGDANLVTNARYSNCIRAFLNLTFHWDTDGSEKRRHIPYATNARALLLNYNNISGTLPGDLGFSKLSYLALANNKLTGPIPPSIGNLQDSLFEVLLLNNQLSGCLPQELGMLTKATVIDAGMNQLTGPIPSSFSCLTRVEQLNLAGNRLYGDIPDSLCKLTAGGHLVNLTLSGNYFTSVGPACSSLIQDGGLDVNNNCIPGLANQRRPAECAAFLSQPKTCPAASVTHAGCPAAAAAPASRVVKDYSSYVTYGTLHQ